MKIKWNRAGFAEARSSPAVIAEVGWLAADRARGAGRGYEVRGPEVSGGRGRARAAVITATVQAAKAEARQHRLAGGVR